ncbi:MAG: GAF domain/GGDEF domain/EAL domain protein [uncultured Paraburkholderia sp.]|uniref:sensor domain-containing phosphodiesterase n=1 Tax=uncultured Paraburkholderia sp. TaxID=1822466 RepID=UPI00259A2A6D|nr:EAL domain-containing protein [uncultured Paraburkholderia sp.]CAH2900686.1 MAG: GAF domain/GGDEF domain/EAL domain protein [uncultured Paraburkholderia sp.]CAH2929930.1 MAG: GAF domain/GGDEF domain/EAL domain protein [uncultured Paraburkholderia sp.]
MNIVSGHRRDWEKGQSDNQTTDVANPEAELTTSVTTAARVDTLLQASRDRMRGRDWAWYRAGDKLRLAAYSGAETVWPDALANDALVPFCESQALHCWPTGTGDKALGWLLAPLKDANDEALAAFANTLGLQLLGDALVRAQHTQRVLHEIAYLASSTGERSAFLHAVHQQLATIIDAENFYLALYEPESRRITYPYYVDVIDVDALESESYDMLDPDRLSLTAQVLTTGQPLLIDAAGIQEAEAAGRFFCVGDRPEFWMGAPLKNASDEVFGMLAMQVYDVSRIYSADDRALFLVVARHVAMALDRILHRANLENIVARRTSELSELNDALRQEVAERKRAEHLQSALFSIAELSSASGDMVEFFRSLHRILGELLYVHNFYIALYDEATATVSFPYYVDELVDEQPAPRRYKRGFTEYVIAQRRPCLFNRTDAERLIRDGKVELDHDHLNLRSWLGVPLFEAGKVRGMLAVQSYSTDVQYTPRDQELLTFVSRHIDTALSRRSAADALYAANLELEARVQERTRELDRANAQLLHENFHDSLTGLPNRSHLLERLGAEWIRHLDSGRRLVVMFLDLDRFKVVNDSLGHHFGDQLLVSAAKRLRDCLSRTDMLARLGGDEFAILSPEASLEAAVTIAERILSVFDLPFHIDDHVVFSSCSIGIVTAEHEFHREPADLLRDADTAMYRAKNGGRDSYVVFNQELRHEVSDRMRREGALRNALKRDDELIPFFQPIICTITGRLTSLEALVRWRQQDGRLLAPGEFLPAMEGLRLIGRLDLYMLNCVAAILAQPAHAGWPPVHVNCSSYSMTRAEFAGDVLALLQQHGVAPSRVRLELTEGALIAEPEVARQTMQHLIDNGVSVVLDDFGTGFSSLSYVHQYHFSALKVDKSFIVGLTSSPRTRAIVRAIVRMAESLGLGVVAEGVEDAVALAALRDIGATEAQGYYIGRPMPLAELAEALSAGKARQWLVPAEQQVS